MAGLSAAARARELGAAPVVFEKGTRPGGSMLLSSCVIWRFREWDDFRAECATGDERLQRVVWERLDEGIAWLEALGAPVVKHETGNPRTVGDSVNAKPDGSPYRMVGIPDGLGAFDNGDGTFTVLMNHELGSSSGIVRAHGARGAFVSKWTIDTDTLQVLHGEDLIQQVATWNVAMQAYNPPAKGVTIGRLCSADLPAQSAFYNAATGKGYNGRLFMDGEEVGSEGRAFAHGLDGTSWELPALVKFGFENAVANPGTGDKTVVFGTDDSTPGQVY